MAQKILIIDDDIDTLPSLPASGPSPVPSVCSPGDAGKAFILWQRYSTLRTMDISVVEPVWEKVRAGDYLTSDLQWVYVDATTVGAWLYSRNIHFCDDIMATDPDWYERLTISIAQSNTNPGLGFRGIATYRADPTHCVILTSTGATGEAWIIYTDDYGATWNYVEETMDYDFGWEGVYNEDGSRLYHVRGDDDDNRVMTTSDDHGQSLDVRETICTNGEWPLNVVAPSGAADAMYVVTTADGGSTQDCDIYRNSNNGEGAWTKIDPPSGYAFNELRYNQVVSHPSNTTDTILVWCQADGDDEDFRLFESTDAGDSWSEIYQSTEGSYQSLGQYPCFSAPIPWCGSVNTYAIPHVSETYKIEPHIYQTTDKFTTLVDKSGDDDSLVRALRKLYMRGAAGFYLPRVGANA